MEDFDVYDRYRNKIGKTVVQGSHLSDNEFRLVVHVCIINRNRQMLIQQRQAFKKGWPNKWDLSVGGRVNSGEQTNKTAEREVFEELGYKLDLRETRPSFTINFERGFDDYFIIESDPEIEDLILQESEVKQVKWASKETIISMIRNQEFIPYHLSLIHMIFDMKNGYGSHSSKHKRL